VQFDIFCLYIYWGNRTETVCDVCRYADENLGFWFCVLCLQKIEPKEVNFSFAILRCYHRYLQGVTVARQPRNSCLNYTLCLKKTRQLWNDIAQNYKDHFWRHLAKTLKILQNRVCMPEFSCRFAYYQLFNLSNRTPKITQILKVTPHTDCQYGIIQ